MANFPANTPPHHAWTPNADLNLALQHWLEHLQAALDENLVGAYLQGSLAVGDFDKASDVDFLVVLRKDIPSTDIERIHAVHRNLCMFANPWARSFEGSYAPMSALRRLSMEPRDAPGEPRPDGQREPGTWRPGPYAYPFWFVSEDERPVRREYDNCQIVRWVLREKGVRLLGPPPEALVDPISAEDLRCEMAEMLACNQTRLAGDLSWFRTAYGQASGTLVFARALETLATGEVRSKRSALAFAHARLKPRWAELVSAAFDTRSRYAADPSLDEPADPKAVAETLALLDWAVEHSARHR